mgnify:CR=1 FL=1
MVTLEELRAKHQKLIDGENSQGQGSGKSDYASFKQESNLVRILPGKDDPLDFFVESHVHKYQEDGRWKSYHCRRIHNEACPMCDLMWDLWKLHKDLNLPKGTKSKYGNLATRIKARPRFYTRAVVRELVGQTDDAGAVVDPVKYVVMSDELFQQVMGAITDEDLQDEGDPDNTTILSLDRGNDFDIRITKKGDYNSFVTSKAKIKKIPAGTKQEIAAWMDSPLDVKALISVPSYEDGKTIAQSLMAGLDTVEPSSPSKDEPSVKDSDSESEFKKNIEV